MVARVTTSFVKEVANEIGILTDGEFSLQEISHPSPGTVHYVDGKTGVAWKGRDAGRRTLAYFLGAFNWYLRMEPLPWDALRDVAPYTYAAFQIFSPFCRTEKTPIREEWDRGFEDAQTRNPCCVSHPV